MEPPHDTHKGDLQFSRNVRTRLTKARNALSSEADLIEAKKEELKEAIEQTADRLLDQASHIMKFLPWVRSYPWISLGIAFSSGLIASHYLMPEINKSYEAKDGSAEKKDFQVIKKKGPLLETLTSFVAAAAMGIMRDLVDEVSKHIEKEEGDQIARQA